MPGPHDPVVLAAWPGDEPIEAGGHVVPKPFHYRLSWQRLMAASHLCLTRQRRPAASSIVESDAK